MKGIRFVSLVLAIAMVVPLVAGCGGTTAPTAAPTAKPAEASPVATTAKPTSAPTAAPTATQAPKATTAPKRNTVIFGTGSGPDSMNPLLTGTTASLQAQAVVFNGLVKIGFNGDLVPDLATSWGVSADKLTWTLKLRKDVKWQDGQAFTAKDVKYTFEVIADPKYTGPFYADLSVVKGAAEKNAGKATEVEGIKVVDDYTISFTTVAPQALILGTLMDTYIIPAHLLSNVAVADLGKNAFSRAPVGTGPYKLTEWKAAESLRFDAFQDYFGDKAKISTYIWRLGSDVATLVSQLKSGDVDVVTTATADDFAYFKGDAKHGTMQAPGSRELCGEFNLAKPMFQDVRVRQAIAYATDRASMLKATAAGLGTVENSVFFPNWPEYDANLKGYAYDPQKAKSLLAEAGWTDQNGDGVLEAKGVKGITDGTRFSMKVGTFSSAVFTTFAQVVQQNLKDIGIDAQMDVQEFNIYYTNYVSAKNPNWDFACVGAMGLGSNPQNDLQTRFQSICASAIAQGYKNETLDKLIVQAGQTFDAAERTKLYIQAQELLSQDLPVVVFIRPDGLVVYSAGLTFPPTKDWNTIMCNVAYWSW